MRPISEMELQIRRGWREQSSRRQRRSMKTHFPEQFRGALLTRSPAPSSDCCPKARDVLCALVRSSLPVQIAHRLISL